MIALSVALIIMIESGGNPMAQNGLAKGLMQITPVVLADYNSFHIKKVKDVELFNERINREIGTWYLTKRIPQLLEHYKHPQTIKNILIAYNAGIKYVGRSDDKLPREARNYITKYEMLAMKGDHHVQRTKNKNSKKN